MHISNPLNLDLKSFDPPSETEHAVLSLLASYFPETSSITPNQAAEQINSLLPSQHSHAGPNKKDHVQTTPEFLLEFWDLMFCIGPQLDYQHEPMRRFVALVKALKSLPETVVVQEDGEYHGQPVWRGPYFEMMRDERWHRIPENRSPEDLNALHWRNMNALLAYFTNYNICTNHYRAFACITRALDEYRRKTPTTPINHRVPAAAVWFVLCPSVIYQACQRQECADHVSSKNLWKGEPQQGYSIARWNFWRKRFEELEGHPDATEETKEACRAAMEAMDQCSGVE